jgi:hypothetical protein
MSTGTKTGRGSAVRPVPLPVVLFTSRVPSATVVVPVVKPYVLAPPSTRVPEPDFRKFRSRVVEV